MKGLARRLGVVCVFMVVPRCGKSPEKMKVAVHGKWEEVKWQPHSQELTAPRDHQREIVELFAGAEFLDGFLNAQEKLLG